MRTAHILVVLVLGAILLASVGCGRDTALVRQAEVTCARLLAAEAEARPSADRPLESRRAGTGGGVGPTLFFAPREEEAGAPAGGEGGAPEAATPASPSWESIEGKSFGEILKADIREGPAAVGRGFVHTFGKPENLLILGAAFGVDRIVRHNWDEDVRHYFEDNDSSLAETDDFGTIIGNPGLHFLVGGAWYLSAVQQRDARHHELSKVLLEALIVNGTSTMAFKVAMGDRSPNGEKWGWPSGHTSSSVCIAAVLHEYYGWKAGVPLYLLAGYTAATRLDDREHDLSDLVFGAALGYVVGHSVVKGELPEIGGFTILPYAARGAGGVMFVKGF
jgi:hypothetical protein